MKITPRIKKAMAIAAKNHEGQLRHDGFTPYICHPIFVAIIVSEYTDDENLTTAALLHDTIEDTGYTAEKLESDFGAQIKSLIMELTVIQDEGPGRNWRKQNEKFLKNLPSKSKESLIIKMADNIHNLSDTADGYEAGGQKFLDKFNTPIEELLKHDENVMKFMWQKFGNIPLVREYEATLQNTKRIILG